MRIVALGAMVTGLLLLGGPTRHSRIEPSRRFDAPDAAARYAAGRRKPLDRGIDVAAAYERAATERSAMTRFSSRIGRTLPGASAPASVWTSGARIVALDRASTTALLDAWTPLGPGNIGGRTRVVRYHPTRLTTIFAAGVSGGIWRSDDDGGSWRPISDGLANLTVNALAIDPRAPDVMYAGTGEGYVAVQRDTAGRKRLFAFTHGRGVWRVDLR